MILDAEQLFSNAQALTATAVGTNVIDLVSVRSMGNGEPVAVMFTVGVAADQGTGDEDYTFEIEYATNAAQSTGRQLMGRRIFESGTPTAPAQNADLLVAGFRFYIPVPAATTGEAGQYLGVRYTLSGTSPSITVDAALVPHNMAEVQNYYASGYSVS